MPAPYVQRKVEDIIYYYYAKLVIAPSAGFPRNYKFIIDAYKKLKSGELQMSDYDRELTHLAEQGRECAFCLASSALAAVHIVPRDLAGPIGIHNTVYACASCKESKADRDMVDWWCGLLKRDRDDIPRVPLGLYLKIAYEIHRVRFSLKDECQDLSGLFSRAVPQTGS